MAKKQTAKEYFLANFIKIEAALQQAKDFRDEAEEKGTTFVVQELIDMIEDSEINEAAERVANLITDLAKNL